jgi:hypothetical protein
MPSPRQPGAEQVRHPVGDPWALPPVPLRPHPRLGHPRAIHPAPPSPIVRLHLGDRPAHRAFRTVEPPPCQPPVRQIEQSIR